MMQIDDRSHKKFIKSGNAYDLSSNLTYGLDLLYTLRETALRKPCGKKGKTAEAVSRSVYSAYNGGPGSRCRWTKNSKWSRNDQQFLEKYRARLWEKSMGRKVSNGKV
jgi:hypothetical protein